MATGQGRGCDGEGTVGEGLSRAAVTPVPPRGQPISPELGVAVLAAEAGVVEDEFIGHQPLHGVHGFLAGSAHLLHLCLQAEGLAMGRAKGDKGRSLERPGSLHCPLPCPPSTGALGSRKQPHLPHPPWATPLMLGWIGAWSLGFWPFQPCQESAG